MKYRAEIDGLRTIAVLPVILFHAGLGVFPGGFTGVDIFFVISGYLITTILVAELDGGRFSILRFYERRARRILPALFTVIACTIPVAWIQLDPVRFTDFSQSILACMAFVSNILFWRESGYFDTDAENKPLLHTWSLAVEEQYYVFFPVMMFVLWRHGRRTTLGTIVGLALLSLGLCEWGSRHWSSANFYLLPSRMWELFAGSVCAFAMPRLAARGNQGLAGLGLALLVGGILLIDDAMRFPSLVTLVPVAGAVLVILFARTGTLVASLLSWRPMVGIGLISYSIYLWHQPILAIARLKWGELGLPLALGLVGLSVVLAALTWRYVEQPFRRGAASVLPTRAGVFAASAAGMGALAVFGTYGTATGGIPGRYPEGYATLLAGYESKAPDTCKLAVTDRLPELPVGACLRGGVPGRAPEVLLLGDSHAWAVSEAVTAALEAQGISSYIATHDACAPVPGIYKNGHDYPGRCEAFRRHVLAWAREAGVGTLLLVGRYSPMMNAVAGFDNGEGGNDGGAGGMDADIVKWEAGTDIPDEAERLSRLRAGVVDNLLALSEEFRLVLVDPIPEAGWHVPSHGMRLMRQAGAVSYLSTSLARYEARAAPTVEALHRVGALAAPGRVVNVSPARDLCHPETGRCDNIVDGVPLYFDDDHLSLEGAELVAPRIAEAVPQVLQGGS